jgi:hypothetical protein
MVLGENTSLKSRFTIVPKKKTKLPPGQDKRTRSPKRSSAPQNEGSVPKSETNKDNGFWKRSFGRKSGDK